MYTYVYIHVLDVGIDDLISLCDELLLETAKKNWDASHLAQRLQQTRLTEEDARVFEKVWGKESARVCLSVECAVIKNKYIYIYVTC